MVLILVLVVLAAGGLGAGWVGSQRAMHPAPATFTWGLKDFPSLAPEQVWFTSRTGVTIAGRFFPGQSRSTVILSHGYGGNQDEMLPIADALHQTGLSVFTYDLRGCGQSGGRITFGALEQQDLTSAVDYLVSRSDVNPARIGALGFSMGGATTLMTAAHDPRVAAVVADSSWSDVYHWLRPSWRDAILHPTYRFSPLALKFAELRSGIDLSTLKPVSQVAGISPRPLLFIHGTADEVVPESDSEQNFAAAKEPKDLWLVEGAAHADTMVPGNTAYAERVATFFQQNLGS